MIEARRYDSRLDRFRVRNGLGIEQWASESGMSRTQINKYRAKDDEPSLRVLKMLAAAAGRILRKPVHPTDLCDMGQDEPVASEIAVHREKGPNKVRKRYGTRLDTLLMRLGVPPSALARAAGLSRQALRELRAGMTTPTVSTIRRNVIALRRMGHKVNASDLFGPEAR